VRYCAAVTHDDMISDVVCRELPHNGCPDTFAVLCGCTGFTASTNGCLLPSTRVSTLWVPQGVFDNDSRAWHPRYSFAVFDLRHQGVIVLEQCSY
jgi:hypothetical protein